MISDAEQEAAEWQKTSEGWARRYDAEKAARQEAEYRLAELFNAARLYIEGPDACGYDKLCLMVDHSELRRRAGVIRQLINCARDVSLNPDWINKKRLQEAFEQYQGSRGNDSRLDSK